MFKKLLHGKRKSALLNLTWSGLLCRVVWSVSQLLYLLQRAGHFKFFSPSFFVGLELDKHSRCARNARVSGPVVQRKYARAALYQPEPIAHAYLAKFRFALVLVDSLRVALLAVRYRPKETERTWEFPPRPRDPACNMYVANFRPAA